MNSLRKKVLYTSGLIATGLILGWLLFSGPSGGGESNHVEHNHLDREELDRHIQDAHTDDEGEIIYTCSMHPQIRENEPGNCPIRSEEHTSELQSRGHLVCRLLLEKKKKNK